MYNREFFYTVEPEMISVTKEEYESFLENYPRKLTMYCSGISEPPLISANDFKLANRFPYSIVAERYMTSDDPDDYYYDPNPKFYIMKNYEKVFNSKTGNKAED